MFEEVAIISLSTITLLHQNDNFVTTLYSNRILTAD